MVLRVTGLEFASATIGQFVWPVFIIVVVLLLREPIKQLMVNPRLMRVKGGPGGLELELREDLDQAEKKLETVPTTHEIEPKKADEDTAHDFIAEMERLAHVAPRAVVLESHARLERLLRNSVDVPAGDDRRPRYLSMRTLTRAAAMQGLLSDREASVLDELTYMRNRVAHEPDEVISLESARRYAELSAEVAIAVCTARGETRLDGPML
jgi:hypothetical protein